MRDPSEFYRILNPTAPNPAPTPCTLTPGPWALSPRPRACAGATSLRQAGASSGRCMRSRRRALPSGHSRRVQSSSRPQGRAVSQSGSDSANASPGARTSPPARSSRGRSRAGRRCSSPRGAQQLLDIRANLSSAELNESRLMHRCIRVCI